MADRQSGAGGGAGEGLLVLGVDTCGAEGSVALARVGRPSPEFSRSTAWEFGQLAKLLAQITLEGRTYSATLIAAVDELLTGHGVGLRDIGAIVVVHGPGSFTGIRVGVSAVKGLAEPGQIPVAAVSRLAVLSAKAGVGSAALDAHRHEVFLQAAGADGSSRQLLAGAEEISQVSTSRPRAPSVVAVSEGAALGDHRSPALTVVAVCEEAAEGLLRAAWPGVRLVRVEAPTAADAIRVCVPAILAGEFADLAALDGHYLRRSDAEIFGDAAAAGMSRGSEFRIRPLAAPDVDRLVEIAAGLAQAPQWPRSTYDALLNEDGRERIVLVAEDSESGRVAGFVVARIVAPEAELESIAVAGEFQRRGMARELFGALAVELKRRNVAEIMLEVRAGNDAAHGLYRSLGFGEEGRRRGYYADPVEDAVLMRLRLA